VFPHLDRMCWKRQIVANHLAWKEVTTYTPNQLEDARMRGRKTYQQERLQEKERNRRLGVQFSKHKWTVPCQLIPIMGLFYTRRGLLKIKDCTTSFEEAEMFPQHGKKTNDVSNILINMLSSKWWHLYYDIFWSSPCSQFLQRNQLTFKSLKLVFN